jgi:hypothetical protein
MEEDIVDGTRNELSFGICERSVDDFLAVTYVAKDDGKK